MRMWWRSKHECPFRGLSDLSWSSLWYKQMISYEPTDSWAPNFNPQRIYFRIASKSILWSLSSEVWHYFVHSHFSTVGGDTRQLFEHSGCLKALCSYWSNWPTFRYITGNSPKLSHLHPGNWGSRFLVYQITRCHNLEGHYKYLYLIENFEF